jgi:arabinofuranosyltransferase
MYKKNLKKYKLYELTTLILWVLSITWLAFFFNGSLIGIDDADIFFTYAENLSNGKGLVYSNGIPVVEGYTSTLWMLILSILFLLKLNEYGPFVIVLLLFLFSQIIIFRIIDKNTIAGNSIFYKIIYLAIASLSFGYISWSTITLMDTTIWSFICLSMIYFLVFNPISKKGWILFGIVCALAPITRPEALLVVPVIIFLMWVNRKVQNLSNTPIFVIFFIFLSSVSLQTLFRIIYFGHIFPNTYYAKVSPSRIYNLKIGFKYLINFISENPIAALSVCLAIFYLVKFFAATFKKLDRSNKASNPLKGGLNVVQLLSIVSILFLMIPLISGGDHFGLFRQYQIIYPLFILLVILVVDRFLIWFPYSNGFKFLVIPMFAVILLMTLLVENSWVGVVKNGSPIAHEFKISRYGRVTGEKVQNIFSHQIERPSVGVITAGGFSRTYQGPIYDLMGLNNSYIAHFPGDRIVFKNHAAFEPAAFFNLPVDVVLVDDPSNGFIVNIMKGLFTNTNFIKDWRWGNFCQKLNSSECHEAFYRKEFIDNYIESGYYTFKETKKYNSSSSQWEGVQ